MKWKVANLAVRTWMRKVVLNWLSSIHHLIDAPSECVVRRSATATTGPSELCSLRLVIVEHSLQKCLNLSLTPCIVIVRWPPNAHIVWRQWRWEEKEESHIHNWHLHFNELHWQLSDTLFSHSEDELGMKDRLGLAGQCDHLKIEWSSRVCPTLNGLLLISGKAKW